MTKSPVDFRESLQSWLKSQLGLSKPKESLIDLNVKSDIQHPVYLKQITVARWNPKTSWREAGDRMCGALHPKADSESKVFHDNFVNLGRRHYKYANVSSHIFANLVTERKFK